MWLRAKHFGVVIGTNKKNEKKGEIIMEIDWSLVVQIGILGSLIYIIWVLKAVYELRTENWDKLYTRLDEIKDKQ